jgi:general secretion pathway protein D
LSIVNLLDVNIFKNKEITLIKFENADAEKVVANINEIFKGYPGLDPTKYYIVALKEMNALLCISSVQEVINEVNYWAKKFEMDSEVGEVQVFVYRVEHSDSEDLSSIIKELYTNDYRVSKSKDGKITQKPILQGDIKIITDKTNNALIFKCTKRDYNIIEKTLKKLDVPKKQVLIEMKILDLSLTDNFQYGFKWYLRQKAADSSRNQSFDFLSGSLAGTYNFLFDSKTLEGIFSAEETRNKTNVLSQPNILVLDNEQATINIGDQISIQTGNISVPEGTTNGFYNSTSYQYLKTGINLSVKPSISSNGIVRLEIKQSHTIPGDAPESGGNPPIATRDIETIINVPDGKSVLLGGLITETNTHANDSTPLLSKIPILRYFFGGQNKSHSKKELIMIITPRVVYSPEEAIKITNEFEAKVQEFKLQLYGKSGGINAN